MSEEEKEAIQRMQRNPVEGLLPVPPQEGNFLVGSSDQSLLSRLFVPITPAISSENTSGDMEEID